MYDLNIINWANILNRQLNIIVEDKNDVENALDQISLEELNRIAGQCLTELNKSMKILVEIDSDQSEKDSEEYQIAAEANQEEQQTTGEDINIGLVKSEEFFKTKFIPQFKSILKYFGDMMIDSTENGIIVNMEIGKEIIKHFQYRRQHSKYSSQIQKLEELIKSLDESQIKENTIKILQNIQAEEKINLGKLKPENGIQKTVDIVLTTIEMLVKVMFALLKTTFAPDLRERKVLPIVKTLFRIGIMMLLSYFLYQNWDSIQRFLSFSSACRRAKEKTQEIAQKVSDKVEDTVSNIVSKRVEDYDNGQKIGEKIGRKIDEFLGISTPQKNRENKLPGFSDEEQERAQKISKKIIEKRKAFNRERIMKIKDAVDQYNKCSWWNVPVKIYSFIKMKFQQFIGVDPVKQPTNDEIRHEMEN